MIKIGLNELVNSTETLLKLAGMELKAKLAFNVGRLLKAADKEIQEFNTARMNLIRKYGEKDENGELITDDKGNCKIAEGSTEDFSKELTELVKTEVEINANKLRINDFEEMDFTPNDMVILEPFIEFDE